MGRRSVLSSCGPPSLWLGLKFRRPSLPTRRYLSTCTRGLVAPVGCIIFSRRKRSRDSLSTVVVGGFVVVVLCRRRRWTMASSDMTLKLNLRAPVVVDSPHERRSVRVCVRGARDVILNAP